jgi:hypothetical protein
MADVASDLKQRFDWATDVCLEAYEVLPDGRSIERWILSLAEGAQEPDRYGDECNANP